MRRIVLILLAATAVHAEDFEKKYQQFRKYIGRPSLRKRVEGLEILASSGDVRALKVLAKVYAKPPKVPKDHTKYITVSIAWDRFGEPEHVAAWEEWRQKFGKPIDAWLWFRALDIYTMHNGDKHALAIANSKRNVFLRAAALHAIGVYHEPLILPIIPEFLEKRPERGLERALLVEACGRALVRQVNEIGTDEFRNAALKLMKQFDLKETPARTRWVLARCFAKIFKSDKIYLESSKPWRLMLQSEDARAVKIDDRYAPRKRPTFVGIEATGKKIVYVIDMSDSMLTPLTAREKKIMRGPVSGTRRTKKKEEKKDDNPLFGEQELDWKRIKNRFDAAREYLIVSLRSLEPDMQYCVIGFGEQADYFKSTRGLTNATKAAIQNTVSELRAYRPGPKGPNRPHGTLKGTTNMHGGLRRAFMLKGKGVATRQEYVDPKCFSSGCDTIFLLSDGDPTWDDWAATDSRDKGDQVGDPEMGGRGDQSATSLNFPGPYARNRHLFEDVQRMNLFRQVEIHGIGIGEASRGFLEALAGNGLGRVRMIGKSMGKPPEEKKN